MKVLFRFKKTIKKLKDRPSDLSIDYFTVRGKMLSPKKFKVLLFVYKKTKVKKRTMLEQIQVSQNLWKTWNLEDLFKRNKIEFMFGYDPKDVNNICTINNRLFLKRKRVIFNLQPNKKYKVEGPLKLEIQDLYNKNDHNLEQTIEELLMDEQFLNKIKKNDITYNYKSIKFSI